MPNKTGIHWTDFSSNPIKHRADGKNGWFCIKTSEGCRNCYSEGLNLRLGNFKPYTFAYKDEVEPYLVPSELESWKKLLYVGKRMFVFSMTDPFEPEVIPYGLLGLVWMAMEDAERVNFQILTKRPENLVSWEKYLISADINSKEYPWLLPGSWRYWPKNIWIGTSIESQRYLHRIDNLIHGCEAKIKFVSFEPLLEDIGKIDLTGIDWVIVGGESGPKHRKFDPAWAASIRDQCREQGVPFFYKQESAIKPGTGRELEGMIYEEYPE